MKLENVCIIPAIVEAITAVMLNVVGWTALDNVVKARPAIEKGAPAVSKTA